MTRHFSIKFINAEKLAEAPGLEMLSKRELEIFIPYASKGPWNVVLDSPVEETRKLIPASCERFRA